MRAQDKVVIVTGAGSGIGRAAAELFAREGARVSVVDIREEAASEVAEGIRAAGGEAEAFAADVSKGDAVKEYIEATAKAHGRLDAIVNVAAFLTPKPAHELTEDEWDRHQNVNVKATWLTAKYGYHHLRAAGGGTLTAVSSIDAFVAEPNLAAYCASKAALVNLCRALSLEWGPDHIRVNAVCPGTTDTPFFRNAVRGTGSNPDATAHTRAMRNPIGRINTPEDIAPVLLFLASEEAAGVTGAAWVVDGGLTATFDYEYRGA
jgi:NAD(P)-dependent dehydrogenase (short-subunit alcohol dehydrogenase family)